MNQELQQYIQEKIFPQYEMFYSHNMLHINNVIQNVTFLAKEYSLDLQMAYVIAAYHDLGLKVDRENHEKESGKIFAKDDVLKQYFTSEQLLIMKEAIEDHRGSRKERPRNRYGEILSDSDRDFDIKLLAKRQLATSIKNYPEFTTFDQHFEHCYAYIKKRIDGGGHFNLWTNYPVLVQRRTQFEKDFFQKEYAREVYQKEWQRITTDGTYEKIQNYYMDY